MLLRMRLWIVYDKTRSSLLSFHYGYYPAYPLLLAGFALGVSSSLLLPRFHPLLAVGALLLDAAGIWVVVHRLVLPRFRKRREYMMAVKASWKDGHQHLDDALALDELARGLGLRTIEKAVLSNRVFRRLFGPPEKRGMPPRTLAPPESDAAKLAAEYFQWDPEAKVLTLLAKPTGRLEHDLQEQVSDLVRAQVARARGYTFALDAAHRPNLLDDHESFWLWQSVMVHVRISRTFVVYNLAPNNGQFLWLTWRMTERKPLVFPDRRSAIQWGQASRLDRAEFRLAHLLRKALQPTPAKTE